jgi:hypothetical protein
MCLTNKQLSFAVATILTVSSLSLCVLSAHAQRQSSMVSQMDDNRMYEQMNRVATWLNQYCVWNHRFPEQGDEMTWAKEQLNQLVPNPPYDTGALRLTSGFDADPNYSQPSTAPEYVMPNPGSPQNLNRIQLIFDPSLAELTVQSWRTDPPSEWQAAPGTISCISNNQNLFVIWGASLNGLPMRDPSTNRVIMIIGRYNMLYQNSE